MGTKLSNLGGKGCSYCLRVYSKYTSQESWLPTTISIPWRGSSPACELGVPLPLALDIAMGGPTSKGHSVAGQFVACDKMLLLLVHIWFNSQRGAKKSLSWEITDKFWSQRKLYGMCCHLE